MAIGKKGMFFTLIAVVMIVAIIAIFMPNYENYSYLSKSGSVETRVQKANSFMRDLFTDLGKRALLHSSRAAVRSLVDYINLTKKPISNFPSNFTTVLINGTLNGTQLTNYGINYMRNSTLKDRLKLFERLARNELGIDTNLTISRITVYQSNLTGFNQFAVELNLSVILDIGISHWNTTGLITVLVPIEDFYDPYYIMNTNTGYSNKIKFANLTNWTSQLVFYHIDAMKYAGEQKAPSFFMRFENNSANSTCCGFESLINPVKLNLNQNPPENYVDYCFFGSSSALECTGPLYNITGISNTTVGQKFYGFKLETYHIDKYNLTNKMESLVATN